MKKKLLLKRWCKEGTISGLIVLTCLSSFVALAIDMLEPVQASAQTSLSLTCLSPTAVATQAQGLAVQTTATAASVAGKVTSVPAQDNAAFIAQNGLLGQTVSATAALNSLAAKTCVQDGIFKQLAKIFINMLTKSVVNWINSGFQGGPTFVTNPAGFFENLANNEIGAFLQGSSLNFVCSPFKAQIQIALRQLYTPIPNYNGCTLTKIVGNVTGFLNGNFSQGGWSGWLQMSSGNSPYDQYLTAQANLSSNLASPVNTALAQLNWGSGFFSLPDPNHPGQTATPGVLIANQIETATGSNFASAELATSFNDIIFALLNQMTNQLLSPSGLLGGSSNSGYNAFSGSGQNYLYINLDGNGTGTVTDPTGAANCSDMIATATTTSTGTVAACYPSYQTNTLVTLTAKPDSQSSFTGWSGTASCSTNPVCQVTMSNDQSVVATFTQNVSPAISVSFTASPNPVPYGTIPTLSWSAANATSCFSSTGNFDTSNSLVSGNTFTGENTGVAQTGPVTYSISCQSSAGVATTSSVIVSVQPQTTTP